jgi:PAS domain S-box-containing protein
VAIDEDSRIVLFNGAAERTFRCAAAAVLHEPIDRLVSDELLAFIGDFRRRAKVKRGGETCVWAPSGLRAQRYDGETFPIEATFSRVELDTQTLDTIILRDVNDRALAETQIQQLQSVTNYLREELESEQHYKEIVGSSKALMDILSSVDQVADTDAGVLVLGETGTGKELIARAIHLASPRRNKPLIKVNCAAIPRTLVESELFGHEKGAFTGATRTKIGRFELADGGTIFLDEIGEIPNFVQVKLLRVLQERIVERVGGAEAKAVDVRVIAATNRNLEEEVRRGRFRADLYFRLNVFPMRVPSLRERREDIPQLAMHFLELYAQRFGRSVRAITDESLEALTQYDWPGHIRELENVIERAVILAKGETLEIPRQTLNLVLEADLAEPDASAAAPRPPAATAPPPPAPAARTAAPEPASLGSLEDVERRHILAVLDASDWVIEGAKGAAKVLAMHPNTLRSRMKRLGIVRKG